MDQQLPRWMKQFGKLCLHNYFCYVAWCMSLFQVSIRNNDTVNRNPTRSVAISERRKWKKRTETERTHFSPDKYFYVFENFTIFISSTNATSRRIYWLVKSKIKFEITLYLRGLLKINARGPHIKNFAQPFCVDATDVNANLNRYFSDFFDPARISFSIVIDISTCGFVPIEGLLRELGRSKISFRFTEDSLLMWFLFEDMLELFMCPSA